MPDANKISNYKKDRKFSANNPLLIEQPMFGFDQSGGDGEEVQSPNTK